MLKIVEGVSGVYYYHLASETDSENRPVCGAKGIMMSTQLRLDSWGYRGHLREKYCEGCASHLEKA